MEEDCNMLAADGIILCCCCPCLILQITVFVLLRLPHKLMRKSKRFVSRRICKRKRRREKIAWNWKEEDQDRGGGGGQMRVQEGIVVEGFVLSGRFNDCGDGGWTIMEVEKVLEELSQQGEFAFGSFWRREEMSNSFIRPQMPKQDCSFDDNLHYHLFEMLKSVQTV